MPAPTGLDRTTIIRGPGALLFGTVPLHDAQGIEADIMVETNPISSSLYGKIDEWVAKRHGEVSFRPAGELSAAILGAMFPYLNPALGASIFGAADVPLTVQSAAGVQVVFTNAALVACPSLLLSPTKVAFSGSAKFRCVLGKGLGPTDANALLTPPANVAFNAANFPFVAANVKGGNYVGTLTPAGGAAVTIRTLAGWTIDMTLATDPVTTDDEGLIDETLKEVTLIAKCQPIGLSEAALLALVPYAAAQGASLAALGNQLVITAPLGSGAIAATLNNVACLKGPLKYGTTTLRAGEIAFVAHRAIVSNVPAALGSIGIVANPPS